MKPKNQNRTCPEVLSNECIVWQGGDVPALGIENGDQLSEAEYIITGKILELFDDIDMSEIDINCIQTTCQQTCKDTSLKAIIQLLYDNQCCLADLITGPSADSTAPTVTVNMSCLTVYDAFGNVVPQDLNQTLQSLINQVCTNKTSITSINTTLTSLQGQISTLQTTPTVTPEPNITTCLSPGLQPVSQVVPIVAQALCTYQAAFGLATDASIAMSQQCANLNSTFATTQGWLTSVQNFAQSVNNLWVLACNLNSRVTNIENNCCALTCADVKIGFAVSVDTSGTGVYLKFTAGAGTSIPNGFTDCGSTVTFTDKNSDFVTYPLVISNNATAGDFDLSGLDLTDPITISVTSVMCASGLTCQGCITRLYTIGASTCPVCQVSASGTTGNVSIAYQIPGSTTIQTLVLAPGETSYIQTNAVIMAVASTGDTTASSTCINLTPPAMTCYLFTWAHSEIHDDTLNGFSWNTVVIGNLSYTISAGYADANLSGTVLFNELASVIPAAIMKPTCIITDTDFISEISVQVPSTLPIPYIKATANTGTTPATVSLYMYAIASTNASTDCGCNTSGGGGSDA
jgi:hypothetical protein